MKRIISILFVVIQLICVNSAFSEEDNKPVFEIHNGVQFGMTMEEVIAYETAGGFKYNKKYSDPFNFNCVAVQGKIAGQDMTIYYSFNNEKELIQASYCFPKKMFDSLEAALTKKYGEADHSYITQKRYDDFELRPKVHRSVFTEPMFPDIPWSQRIIKISDSLTIAINHYINTPSGDIIVYSSLSAGNEGVDISEIDLNDL